MKKALLCIVVLVCLVYTGYSQDEITLKIGDAPPPLNYSKWIKGEPVESFDGDQLYILEFWATWCGPCKAAMPHLTKLQEEYRGKATFIGVDVWERVKEGQPYESSLPAVEKFVKGNAAHMGYSVIADNNEHFMGNNWLKAAGIGGIPSTFIIKDNKIIWIGHPISLDTTLPKILNGQYDMEAFKTAYDKRAEASNKQSSGINAAIAVVQAALKARDYKKAFELMEKAKADQPMFKIIFDNLKFTTLLKDISEEEAMAFATEWTNDYKNAASSVLGAVAEEDSLSKKTYLAAAKMYVDSKQERNPIASHILALCYAKGGDYKNAVVAEERAVADAKVALKEGKMIGSIMDYTITEYEEALAKYKKQAARVVAK